MDFDHLKPSHSTELSNNLPTTSGSSDQNHQHHAGVAQTASLSEHEMMTYIKIPSLNSLASQHHQNHPHHAQHEQQNHILSSGSSVAGDLSATGGATDDARAFLDGLFDRLSGSSDNGSDKGEKSDSASASMVDGHAGDIPSAMEVLPQHLLYGTGPRTNGLPPNVLQYQQQIPAGNEVGGVGIEVQDGSGGTVQATTSTSPNGVSSPLQSWITAVQSISSAPLPQQQAAISLPYNVGQVHNPCTNDSTQQAASHVGGVTTHNYQVPVQMPLANITMPNMSAVGGTVSSPKLSVPSPTKTSPISNITPPTKPKVKKTRALNVKGAGATKKVKRNVTRKRSKPSSPSTLHTISDKANTLTDKSPPPNANASSQTTSPSSNKVSPPPVSEDESDAQKRRRGRNQREQERSQRIASQIANLKDLLSQSNVSFKPDKYSTLVSVHDYIVKLTERVGELDREHKSLVDTIAGAGEIVSEGLVGSKMGVSNEEVVLEPVGSSSITAHASRDGGDNENKSINDGRKMTRKNGGTEDFVQGLDYKNFFFRCTEALCVASIDGRLLEVNDEFIKVCGLTREVLGASGLLKRNGLEERDNLVSDFTVRKGVPDKRGVDIVDTMVNDVICTSSKVLSLFNLLARDDMGEVFSAMSAMLKSNADSTRTGELNHWTGIVNSFSGMKRALRVNITLVRQKCGTPSFFNCAVTSHH